MQKTPELFDVRNEQKKKIEFADTSKRGDVGEFWRYREGVNLGNEISKDGSHKRVCLILQNNLGNGLLLVAPITTKYHERMADKYIEVENPKKYGLKPCRIIINQIKLIDTKRFFTKTGAYRQHITFANLVRKKYVDLIL